MRKRRAIPILLWVSISLTWVAFSLAAVQLVRYSRSQAVFPPGSEIAGVPVGSLDSQQSTQRLRQVYGAPVELHYGEVAIHLDPAQAGFQLNLEAMLAEAEQAARPTSFWVGYWNYLWGRRATSVHVPLHASHSEERLRDYLGEQVAPRYDKPASPPMPVVGTVNYQPGIAGTILDVDDAILPITEALRSTSSRVVELPLQTTDPPKPSMQNLEVFLKQTIDLSGFDGLAGIYLLDLQTAEELNFAYLQGKEMPIPPDVAFTAASIIKIPIMVSVFRQIEANPEGETAKLLQDMIEESGNEAADWLMQRVIDPNFAPLEVSADMQALGLENTFLAGYFYPGAPPLRLYETPANQRRDVNTNPDVYNQTTPSDIGMLLEDIYHCSQNGGGTLAAVFLDEFTQAECEAMVNYLTLNKMPALVEAGLPPGTRLAHKHGWVSFGGVIHTIGDAGIVYTPGGDYVLVIFLYRSEQLLWDPARFLVSDLSSVVYNYFNYPNP